MDVTKSVKFNKAKASPSAKKKFAKTPHSSKVARPADESESPVPIKKKRKLSFSSADLPNGEEEAASAPSVNGKPKHAVRGRALRKLLTPEERKKEMEMNTIFVGNLPVAVDHRDLADCFSVFGKVLNARIRCIPLNKKAKSKKGGAILQQFDGDTAAAYVRFETLEEAKLATAANGLEFDGRHLRIDLADPLAQKKTDPKKAVFLRGLNYEVTEDELWEEFQKCGDIESVRLVREKVSYKPRGMAYVNFKSTASAELALKLNDTEILGRVVKVLKCLPPLQERPEAPKRNKDYIQMRQQKKKEKKAASFAGKKVEQQKNKNKHKKMDAEGKKKKKLAEILAK